MLVREQQSNRRTFFLRETENDIRMTLQVQDVPPNAVVMRFDKGERRPLFEPDRGFDFGKRCDFVILEESETEHTAVFIELKTKFETVVEGEEREHRGEKQLRWSYPSLKYLLAVFETDKHKLRNDRSLTAIYYLVAKPPDASHPNRSHPNPSNRRRRTREHFISDHYEGIIIHYITKNQIKFKQLKSRRMLPALS